MDIFGGMARDDSSLWWNPRERRDGRGARLTRRVREEYLVYFDRNATMRAAKRPVQAGCIARRTPRGFHHRLLAARRHSGTAAKAALASWVRVMQ